jgi:hypothetical protein
VVSRPSRWWARARSASLLRIELLEVRLSQELHAHRGDLGELRRVVAVEARLEVAALERVEGMAAFVEQRLDVAVEPGGVRER